MMLYAKGALTTRKSVMVVAVYASDSAVIGRAMVPIGWIASLEKFLSGVEEGLSEVNIHFGKHVPKQDVD